MSEYPKQNSLVEVTFLDGEVKTYTITAGIGIGRYLANEAAATGVLTLFNNDESHGIPLAQVREYVLRPLPDEPEATAEDRPGC